MEKVSLRADVPSGCGGAARRDARIRRRSGDVTFRFWRARAEWLSLLRGSRGRARVDITRITHRDIPASRLRAVEATT